MIEGKTKTGFKYKIDERALKDWRLMDSIQKATSPDPMEQISATSSLIDLLLGKDKDRLMAHVEKKNDGFIPVDAVVAELLDIITGSDKTKNSLPSPK